MAGFTKLFSTIVTSSIWCEDNETRLVWITMLALSDANGMVEAAVPGLANAARVSVEKCEMALERFQKPDVYSRSTAHEGRRVERVEGGWKLLNYQEYREKLSKSDRLDYQRVKQSEYRARRKQGKGNGWKNRGTSDNLPGEDEYVRKERKGASLKELDDHVTAHLPEAAK